MSAVRDDDLVVIYSDQWGMYWRPGAAGYTKRIEEAGRYTRAHAIAHTRHCGAEKRIEIRPAPAPSSAPASPHVATPAEVDALRGELTIANQCVRNAIHRQREANAYIAALRAEVERLREALRKIADIGPYLGAHATIARAALGDTA